MEGFFSGLGAFFLGWPIMGGIPALLGIALLIYHVVQMVRNPKRSMKTFIGIGILVVGLLIFWALASNGTLISGTEFGEGGDKESILTPGNSKLIGGLVNFMFFGVLVSFLLLIAALGRDIVKGR